MAELCGICEEAFGERPRTEILCHHIFHTECLFLNIATAEHLDLLRCATCQNHVFLNDNEDQDEDNHTEASLTGEENRISNLYDTNEAFRKDIQKYKLAVRSVSKPKQAFRRLMATKKAELAPTWSQIKHQYEGLYHTKKDELTHSPEYKAYRSADAKISRLWTNLRAKYNVNGWSLRGLRTKPGCKTLHRYSAWRDSPQRLIRRALRLRLPYW